MPARGLLGWEGGGSDAADAVGVADALDLDDLAAGDGEGQNDEGAPFPCDDHSRGAVDQHRVQLSTSAAAGQLRHGLCAVDVNWAPSEAVVSRHDVGVEHLDEGVEVAGPGRRKRLDAVQLDVPAAHGREVVGRKN